MKYRNTQKAIVIVGPRESVPPFGITRDFTEEDAKTITELRLSIQKGYLVPDDGKGPAAPVTASPRARTWTESADSKGGNVIRKQMATGKPVEYVTADDVGVDGIENIGPGDPDMVVALETKKSLDRIEEGVVARTPKPSANASDAFDKVLEDENEAAEFDDEKILAENEPERPEIGDADAEISRDQASIMANMGKPQAAVVQAVVTQKVASAAKPQPVPADEPKQESSDISEDNAQVLVGGGKSGAQLQNVQQMVTEAVAKAMGQVEAAAVQGTDDAERVSTKASGRAVEFFRQSFSQKKWEISKETDKAFLEEIGNVSTSENVKSLVRQRLSELG